MQSLSRSLYARLIPKDKSGEFFGFYNMLGKFAAILGPALYGFVGLWTGSPRLSDDPAGTILDQAATMGADLLILGSRHRRTLASILKGDIVTAVANNLPENIQLILYG